MLSAYLFACEDIKVHLLWLLLSRRLVPIHLKSTKKKGKMTDDSLTSIHRINLEQPSEPRKQQGQNPKPTQIYQEQIRAK